jgi:hypothetical protein
MLPDSLSIIVGVLASIPTAVLVAYALLPWQERRMTARYLKEHPDV